MVAWILVWSFPLLFWKCAVLRVLDCVEYLNNLAPLWEKNSRIIFENLSKILTISR